MRYILYETSSIPITMQVHLPDAWFYLWQIPFSENFGFHLDEYNVFRELPFILILAITPFLTIADSRVITNERHISVHFSLPSVNMHRCDIDIQMDDDPFHGESTGQQWILSGRNFVDIRLTDLLEQIVDISQICDAMTLIWQVRDTFKTIFISWCEYASRWRKYPSQNRI